MYSRRSFLKVSSLAGGSAVLSTALTGCTATGLARTLSTLNFLHGVASGDPLADGIILWTRATPQLPGKPLTLFWELAEDPEFNAVIRNGHVQTDQARDYTVKIDVTELQPGRDYFYRFHGWQVISPIGRARTLPQGAVKQLRLAVLSCANYPAGHFNVYREAAKYTDLDAVLHLGDYIYEYGMGGYATDKALEIGRGLPDNNSGELYTLDDYRRRYALYRSDNDLQAIHAAAPFIVVWDDHEIANDTWRGGAQNHSDDEGSFEARKLAALQAYFEWLPIRPANGQHSEQIYRSFEFGELAALHMLDTRVIGRDKQLDYPDFVDAKTGIMDHALFRAKLGDPQRSMVGKPQLSWLAGQIEQSSAHWQLLGQQVLMGKMNTPAEMLTAESLSDIPVRLAELVQLKRREQSGETLTDEQQARLAAVTPYNLDAWDGYPVERERLYQLAEKAGKKLVVVAGDTHNAWYSKLVDQAGQEVGVEFATSSVSSPGMESYFGMDDATAIELAGSLPLLVDDLHYCNLHQRGFLLLTVDQSSIQAHWQFVDNVSSSKYRVDGGHRVEYSR